MILEKEAVHQKVELPEIKPVVTEYRLQKGYCVACKKKISASLPEGVTWDLLEPNAKTIISSFTGFFINSKREVQQILSSIFNLSISLGLVSKTRAKYQKNVYQNTKKQEESYGKASIYT